MASRAWRKWRAPGCAVALALLAPGCIGYRLGSTLPPEVKTVYVAMFVNRCGEPEIEATATRATRQEFQKDGTLRIVDDENAADVVLTTTLTGYKLEPLSFRRDDPKTTQEYRLRITADVRAVLRRTGQVVTERRTDGEATFEFTGDLASAKIAALPKTAADLAHRIVGAVVEAW